MMETEPDVVIKMADMSEELQADAVQLAKEAVQKYEVEKDIAMFMKKEFDRKHGATWHCVAGHSFGSFVTHESGHFIYFYIGTYAILLFKSG